MKYGNHSIWRKISRSPFVALIVFVVLIIMVRANIKIYQKVSLSHQKLNQANNEVNKLQSRKTDLSGRVDQLSTGEGVEAEIRTKYMAVKEGESVAVIVEQDKKSVTTEVASTTQGSWFGRAWRYLFGF